jgi:hypothetical protein
MEIVLDAPGDYGRISWTLPEDIARRLSAPVDGKPLGDKELLVHHPDLQALCPTTMTVSLKLHLMTAVGIMNAALRSSDPEKVFNILDEHLSKAFARAKNLAD